MSTLVLHLLDSDVHSAELSEIEAAFRKSLNSDFAMWELVQATNHSDELYFGENSPGYDVAILLLGKQQLTDGITTYLEHLASEVPIYTWIIVEGTLPKARDISRKVTDDYSDLHSISIFPTLPAILRGYLVSAMAFFSHPTGYIHVAQEITGDLNNYDIFISPPPLEIIVDPGSASSTEAGEFLASISDLYRCVGGSGITFAHSEIRQLEGEEA